MNMNKTRILFGKNVDNKNKMEVAIFHENELVMSSGHATYLHKVIPAVPEGWHEIANGNLVLSDDRPYYNGNSLEPVGNQFSFQFFHIEKQEEVVYNLPQFKQEEDEKKKNMRFKVLIDDVNKAMIATCVTNQYNASFFFGCGGRHFVSLPKILKPLYEFHSYSAILSPDFEVQSNQYLMAWREADVDGVQQDTFFQVFQNVI